MSKQKNTSSKQPLSSIISGIESFSLGDEEDDEEEETLEEETLEEETLEELKDLSNVLIINYTMLHEKEERESVKQRLETDKKLVLRTAKDEKEKIKRLNNFIKDLKGSIERKEIDKYDQGISQQIEIFINLFPKGNQAQAFKALSRDISAKRSTTTNLVQTLKDIYQQLKRSIEEKKKDSGTTTTTTTPLYNGDDMTTIINALKFLVKVSHTGVTDKQVDTIVKNKLKGKTSKHDFEMLQNEALGAFYEVIELKIKELNNLGDPRGDSKKDDYKKLQAMVDITREGNNTLSGLFTLMDMIVDMFAERRSLRAEYTSAELISAEEKAKQKKQKENAKKKAQKMRKKKEEEEKAERDKQSTTLSGGGGSASVVVEVEPVKVSRSTYQLLMPDVQDFLTNLDSKTFDELVEMETIIATVWDSLNEGERKSLHIPKGHINRKMESHLKSTCFTTEQIITRTNAKKKSIHAGKNFEFFLINHEVMYITTGMAMTELYGRENIMNNDSHPMLQIELTTEDGSYKLADASLYDYSSMTHDIEVKYYIDVDDLSRIAMPHEKFTGNRHFTPYFRVVDGRVVLYKVYDDVTKSFINEYNDKEVIFLIMTKLGLMSYNYTDELTISMSSSGAIKKPFDIRLSSDMTDSKGNNLFYVKPLGIGYPQTEIDFGHGFKPCSYLPEDKLKKCYIKK